MKIVAALLLSLLPACAFAAPELQDKYLAQCANTPSITAHTYPGREGIVTSNKLALPAGKSELADGQLLYLSGRVLDSNCVPVSDAIVDIWQTDPKGNYTPSSLGERMTPYPHFTGSGRAVTDNLGRFNFVTLFPGPYVHVIRNRWGKIIRIDHWAPHINVHVIKDGFATLDTQLYFSGDKRNADDVDLAKLSQDLWPGVMAKVWPRHDGADPDKDGLYGQWDITLRGAQWRHF